MSRLFTLAQLERHRARCRRYRKTHHGEARDPSVPAALYHHNRAVREQARDHAYALELIADEGRRIEAARTLTLARFVNFEEVPIGENRELLTQSH